MDYIMKANRNKNMTPKKKKKQQLVKEKQPIARTYVICDITGSQGSGNVYQKKKKEVEIVLKIL